MDKVKKFLEAYVQWLAIALGAAFLGWTVYGYIIEKPVKVAVGSNQDVAPGDVPGKIWIDVGEPLNGLIKSTSVPPGGTEEGSLAGTILQLFNGPVVATDFPNPYTPLPVPDDGGGKLGPDIKQQGLKITRLPEAAPPINILFSRGHSNVPGATPAAGAAPAVVVQAVDRNWVTVEGTLHVADLAKSFKDIGIAPGSTFSNTCVLRVELIRQQMNGDGTWGPDTQIDPLDINPLQPLPDIMADFGAQKDYVDFAEKNVTPIVQPPFYQVLQGNVWYEPGTPNPNEVVTAPEDVFDPKDPGSYAGDPTKLLPRELKLYNEAKARQKAKDDAKAKTQNRNPVGGPTGGGVPPILPGLPGSPMASDPARPAMDEGIDRPRFGGPPGFAGPPGMPGMPGAQPGVNAGTLPAGSFDPSVQTDFKMWAHDPTVQAGKTYRYKLQYVISNPVARTTGLCEPAKLADQFFIRSKPSAWTDSINVESDTNFYAVEMKHGVHFDVFKWQNGNWQMQSVTVNPGDVVGSVDTNPTTGVKTDFNTGWTLVDIREDPTNTDDRILVLVSENGTVIKKDLLIDADSGSYRKLYLQVNANKPAAANAGGPGNPVQ